MKSTAVERLPGKLKRYALLSPRLLWWAANGQLRNRLRIARSYKIVANSELFDVTFYLKQCPELTNTTIDPLRHYLTVGGFEGRDPNPLFDSDWYLAQNPDVAATGANPLVHFLRDGWKEGRNPHPLFDIRLYVQSDPDFTQSGTNPLHHYLRTGAVAEHRQPHILFDNSWYLEQNPDVAKARHNPLVHYLLEGWKDGRDPHPLFNGDYYLEKNADVTRQGINPLLHFVLNGFREGRDPNPLFSCAFYIERYKDVAGANPLSHYVSAGASEQRLPHALFDPLYYVRENAVVTSSSQNLLQHYLREGARQRYSTHPLFDADFYLEQHPHLEASTIDLLRHYLEEGAQSGSDPCELFDSSYYLTQYPEIAQSGENPLVHYLLEGADRGFNPNALFDSAYYLKQYPDVAASGQNPLVHYCGPGAAEGRAPSPFFDSLFYLRTNPRLRAAKINPLAHFLVGGGAEEGRDPSPFFSTSAYVKEHPEVAELGVNPLAHFLGRYNDTSENTKQAKVSLPLESRIVFQVNELGAKEGVRIKSGDRDSTVICLSHVAPNRPRAGNEYRINRLLSWLQLSGFRVLPVISPLPHDDNVSDDQIVDLAADFGNAIVCRRDGRISYCLSDSDFGDISSLDGSLAPQYGKLLKEDGLTSDRSIDLLNTDRMFCHDGLVHLAAGLVSSQQRCVVIAEYIFMSRVLPLLDGETFKLIDTHDVFSSKRDKVAAYGIDDSLILTAEEEKERLSRADLIIAIQPEEQTMLEKLSGSIRVITAGVDFPVSQIQQGHEGHKVLYVASDNAKNTRGLRDFLRFAWPSILLAVPDAELLVLGKVCNSVRPAFPGVKLLGPVADLRDLYQQAKVTINPALAGTGLKVKTLEALSYLKPQVTWPTGVEGLHPRLAALCSVASDWFEFHHNVTKILLDSRQHWYTEDEIRAIQDHLSPAEAYGSLTHALSAFFHGSKAAAAR